MMEYEQTFIDKSLVVARDLTKHHPKFPVVVSAVDDKTSMSQFILKVGSTYTDPWNSYLELDLTVDCKSKYGFTLDGGFMNLIKSVIIQSREGVELDRCDKLNMLNSLIVLEQYGDDFATLTGKSCANRGFEGQLTSTIATIFNRNIHIPLFFLSPLFRNKSLLPPHLLDGMTIFIEWEATAKIGYNDSATGNMVASISPLTAKTTHTIGNVLMNLDSYQLNPETHENLTRQYATKGMVFRSQCYTLDNSYEGLTNAGTAEDIDIEIVNAYTRAHKAIINVSLYNTIPVADNVFNPETVVPSFHTISHLSPYPASTNDYIYTPLIKYQTHINGKIMGRKEITTNDEQEYNWRVAFGGNKHLDRATVLAASYRRQRTLTVCVPFDRNVTSFHENCLMNTDRDLSGLRIDGTQPVRFNLTCNALSIANFGPKYGTSSAAWTLGNLAYALDTNLIDIANYNRRVDVFVEYEKFILISGDGVKVVM